MCKVVQPDNMEDSDIESMCSDAEMSKIESSNIVAKIKPRSPRIRQYYDGHKGPYRVFIRKVDRDLKYFELNKAIRLKYKSVVDVFLSNKNKMSVTFSSMKEANTMPFNVEWNSKFKVYIPEASVEVMACVTFSTEEDEDDIMKYGEGKFNNSQLKNIKILEVLRLQKDVEIPSLSIKDKVPTSVVRVTFPGQIIPERIEIDVIKNCY